MITVQLTNGFGNNIFQYVAARLLAEHHQQKFSVLPPTPDYYAIDSLQNMGVNISNLLTDGFKVNDENYRHAFDSKYANTNLVLAGYFEDYTYYKNHIPLIKSWFPEIKKRENNDLVIHLRTGDRLFMKNEFHIKPRVRNYLKAIERFDFDKLHIVTDMPQWGHINVQQLRNMKFHYEVPLGQRVDPQLSVDYFNELIDGFLKFDPIVEKRMIHEDFNFIRTFSNILFEHGTLGWWASVLSEATKVGVYGPWRPFKKKRNKNLSKINLEGWFQWE
jgi:hypothetical protein